MFVTRISRYIYRSVLSAVSRNRGRSWNVLPVDTGAHRYVNFRSSINLMPRTDITQHLLLSEVYLIYTTFRKLHNLLQLLFLYEVQSAWSEHLYCDPVPYSTVWHRATIAVQGQLHPVPTTPSNFLNIHLNIILPSTSGSPQRHLSLRFPHQHPVHPSFLPIRATCPAHLILLDLTTRTILGKEYRSFSSLCNFLHSPVTWSLLGSNILLNTRQTSAEN
jgi:hypothetical protein